jgi:16S rRNA (cytidine1402-2'-O)-methyltransferase
VPRLLARLARGESGALITDAGTPGIADPGFLLAREARRAGAPVVVLPGPSIVVTAVVASGFPPQPFVFLGYVPPSSVRRRRFLETLRAEPRTVVVFEAPHRVRATLADAAAALEDRPLAIVRELTKIHEEVRTGTAQDLLRDLPERVRGEIVLVLGPERRRRRGEGGVE